MNTRIWLMGLLLLLCTVTSGCWDRRELQERGFVMAAAIDLAEEGKQSELETYTTSAGTPKALRLSVQVLKLTPSGGGESAPKEQGKTYVVSNTGLSVHEMIRDMLAQVSKGLYFEHIQSILISEAVVKSYNLRQIIDFWRRDAEMRWRTRIFVVPGVAREVLEFVPPTGEAGGIYLANVSRHYTRDPHIGSARTDLGFTSVTLDNKGDVMLPRLEYKDKQVKINGLAIFHQDRFIGYWDEYTIKGIRLGRGNIKSSVFTHNCPDHPGHTLVFELFRHNTILTSHVEDGKIYFTLNVAIRGNLSEATCQQYSDTSDGNFLEEVELMFAEEIKKNISHSFNLAKREGIDPLNLRTYLKAYKPTTWAQIEERWDEIYPDIPLDILVRVSIQNVGEHK